MRLKATEMVGVQLTSQEARRLLEAIAAGKLGPVDDPELTALERKFKVMLQVALKVEKRPRRAAHGSVTSG